MNTNTNAWIHGVASALIGGAANAITVMVIDPMKFNLGTGIGNLASAALISGIVSASFYLKKFPTPADVNVTTVTTTTTVTAPKDEKTSPPSIV